MDTLQIGFLWYGITSRNEKSRKNNTFYAALLPFDNLIADRTGLIIMHSKTPVIPTILYR